MGAIANGLSMLIAKLVAAVGWFGKLFIAIFVAAWDILRDMFAWVFEQVMEIVVSAVGAVDVSAFSGASSFWTGLPSEVTNVLGLIGFGQAMALVVSAILIRRGMQLIPFVRLGS